MAWYDIIHNIFLELLILTNYLYANSNILNIHQFFGKFYHILTIFPVMLNEIIIIARSKNGKL